MVNSIVVFVASELIVIMRNGHAMRRAPNKDEIRKLNSADKNEIYRWIDEEAVDLLSGIEWPGNRNLPKSGWTLKVRAS